MKVLRQTQFGNPILRQTAQRLSVAEISSDEIQTLIADMFYTLEQKKLGVGLAAPQVGRPVAVVVMKVQPTKHRPEVEPFEAVLINPEIVQTFGRRKAMWEGCISGGRGNAGLFAKVPRYNEVEVKYLDDKGRLQQKRFKGLQAQLAQHETDHLSGTLFVDRVKDTTTYMTYSEYVKHVRKKAG
jgi:peptide deformylase